MQVMKNGWIYLAWMHKTKLFLALGGVLVLLLLAFLMGTKEVRSSLISQKKVYEGQELNVPKLFQKELPDYAQFARVSALVEKKEYAKALVEAKLLREKLDAEEKASLEPLLYAYNCLRIALLEGKISSPQEESVAWLAFEKTPKSSLLQKHLRIEGASLADYIKSRKSI